MASMENSIRFRDIEERDLEHIYEICEEDVWVVAMNELKIWTTTPILKDGYIVLEYNDEFGGCINVAPMTDDHCFVGMFMVKKDLRYQGLGKKLWNEALKLVGGRKIGLSSGKHNFKMYAGKGFNANDDHGAGKVRGVKFDVTGGDPEVIVVEVGERVVTKVISYDRDNTGIERALFMRKWLLSDTTLSFVARKNLKIVGFCVATLYRDNMYVVGPMQADSMEITKSLVKKLVETCPDNATFCMEFPLERKEIMDLFSNRDEMYYKTFCYISTGEDLTPRQPKKIVSFESSTLYRA